MKEGLFQLMAQGKIYRGEVKAWELEAAGHMAPAVRKQRAAMPVAAQLPA